MSQSRLETRPSRWEGTSRWSSVNQITINAVMQLSETNATAIACQTSETRPNPAVISIPSAQVRYRTVRARRGSRPRWPITSATVTDPTPPAPKTSPSAAAEPPRSLRTTYGTSTSHGPQVANRLTVPATIATHNQVLLRT